MLSSRETNEKVSLGLVFPITVIRSKIQARRRKNEVCRILNWKVNGKPYKRLCSIA